MNGLSDEGARLVGEALATNENLQELNISGNRISIEGANHIARALEKNTTLLTLRVSTGGTIAPGDHCGKFAYRRTDRYRQYLVAL